MLKIKAFTLVELMVVVAIICVLAAIAFPAYLSYSIHAKLARAIPLMNSVGDQLLLAYQTGNTSPVITVGSSDVIAPPSNASTAGTGGSIFPLVPPFPVATFNTHVSNRGWIVVQGAEPIHGFAVQSARKAFDGENATLIIFAFQMSGLEGIDSFVTPTPTSPYQSGGHGLLINLMVINEETGLISKYCGTLGDGTGQYDLAPEYLERLGCRCKNIDVPFITGIASLNCS